MQKNNKLVSDTIERFKNGKFITTNIAQNLIITNPRTPKFYITPKIYKKGNSGQPVLKQLFNLLLNRYHYM